VARGSGPCKRAKLESLGVPAVVTAPPESGYRLTMTTSADRYTVHADPVDPHTNGCRTFFSDETHVIRQSFEGPANITSNRFATN
jgi:hypothetical protein